MSENITIEDLRQEFLVLKNQIISLDKKFTDKSKIDCPECGKKSVILNPDEINHSGKYKTRNLICKECNYTGTQWTNFVSGKFEPIA